MYPQRLFWMLLKTCYYDTVRFLEMEIAFFVRLISFAVDSLTGLVGFK